MIVYSSMMPDQITPAANEGVSALKAFLQYARNGKLSIDIDAKQISVTDELVNSICIKLEKEGYSTSQMVGNSGYRVDIGVVDPVQPKRYFVGILLDGSSYESSKTTHDRELAQISVLKGLGWDIYRMWSADWWNNADREMSKLLVYLKERLTVINQEILVQVKQPVVVVNEETRKLASGYEVKRDTPKQNSRVYHAATLTPTVMSADEFLMIENTKSIRDIFEQVICQEAPICENLLIRRVLQNFGIARVGARLQSRALSVMDQLSLIFTDEDGQKIYWNSGHTPDTYKEFRSSGTTENRRDAKDVPVQEATNAVCFVLSEQFGLPRGDLIREVGKLLGYSRTGSVVETIVSLGIACAIKNGHISEDQDGYLRCKN